MGKHRFLLVTFPGQGHINPGLQFADRLLRAGAVEVTFAATAASRRRMIKSDDVPDGLTFATYSDGFEHVFKMSKGDIEHYMSEIKRCGSESLAKIIVSAELDGRPFTCLLYTTLMPWAGRVAREHHVPSALLWVQPATVFDVYYYYFNGYRDTIQNSSKDPSSCVELPGLPPLGSRDLPSFFHPSCTYTFAMQFIEEHMQLLREEGKPKIVVNTFDRLENEALKAIDGLELIAVGPLISLTSPGGGDVSRGSKGCMEWLDSKPESSVIYVSFGSYSVLPKPQMEEIARALLKSGKPFLWVNRALEDDDKEVEEEELVSCREELEEEGMIVPWCSQVEVLSHRAVGCFVTHCGWNSTLESLVLGVPVVAFPLWTDQVTNAKLIEDVWKIGVRVEPNDEGMVESGEIGRCLEMVMCGGESGEEMKRNGSKWKELAREAVSDGGFSDKNVKVFVEGIGQAKDR